MGEKATIVKTSAQFFEELNEVKEKVSFLVAYSKETAEPMLISPGDGCTFSASGPGEIPVEMLLKSLKDKEFLNVKTTTICHAYRNPKCQLMTASGDYVDWVCVEG